jgi:thiol-disulfide isomerase/thioredoxin
MRSFPVRRNTLVIGAVLFILAVFGWAGWANWELRKQEAEKQQAQARAAQAVLIPSAVDDTAQSFSPLMDKPAPAFTLEDLSGKKVSLASFRGKAVLLNFWATWCTPCKLETPWIIELSKKYAPQGLEVVGISTEGDDLPPNDKAGWAKDKAAIAQAVKQMHIPYTVLINGDSLSSKYGGLDAMPTSFYVDRKGVIVAAQMGLTSEADMAAKIQKALTD